MSTTVETPALVELLIERLHEPYIFPERSADAAELLRARLREGAYASSPGRISASKSRPTCSRRATTSICGCSGTTRPRRAPTKRNSSPSCASRSGSRTTAFVASELLAGNIGLIELTIVPEVATGGPGPRRGDAARPTHPGLDPRFARDPRREP